MVEKKPPAPPPKTPEQIEADFKSALAQTPGDARLHAHYADFLAGRGDIDNAKKHYGIATTLDPTRADCFAALGRILIRDLDLGRALACFGLAQVHAPRDSLRLTMAIALPPLAASRQEILLHVSRIGQNLAALKKQGLRIPNPPDDGASLFPLAYYGVKDRQFYQLLADIYLAACPGLGFVAPHCARPARPAQGRRLKVGFVSRHFFEHSIARLTRGLIAHLDRSRFEVCVALVPYGEDKTTETIVKSADKAIRLPLDLAGARHRLAREEFDILVYPEIGMDSFTYCLGFARLAPVQCVTWGHPVTTGIPNMDYFVSAADLEPSGAESQYRETLFRLATLPTYYYRPDTPKAPPDRKSLGLDPQFHYYLVPQYLFKLHPDFDPLLVEILKRDPKGRILLVDGARPAWRQFVMARLKKLLPEAQTRAQFMARRAHGAFLGLMAAADVILDIPQFSGGNTSFEAIAAGTPVVTLPADAMRGRVTAAILKKIGMMDLIADSPARYVDLAVKIGSDPVYRNQVRDRLLAQAHFLFEDETAVREWERFFAAAWQAKTGAPA